MNRTYEWEPGIDENASIKRFLHDAHQEDYDVEKVSIIGNGYYQVIRFRAQGMKSLGDFESLPDGTAWIYDEKIL